MIARMLDNLVAVFAPGAGVRRLAARQSYDQLSRRGLDAGKRNRWTNSRPPTSEAGDLRNLAEIQDTRRASWELYYNNVHARKIVRTVVAQVVGCGLKPESLAATDDGEPIEDFQDAALLLHERWGAACDWLGLPGHGGLDLAGLQRQAVRELVLSGEVLVRYRRLSQAQQGARGLPIPLALELIESDRLAETDSLIRPRQKSGENRIFRGIEYDQDGKRIAYHLYKSHPNDPKWWNAGAQYETVPVPADEILHVFFADRPSQTRGVPWFAPNVLELRDVGDYKYNELVASAVASCPSLVVKAEGAGNFGGLAQPAGQASTDRDGNPITRLQPGGIIRLRPGEEATGFNPQRPNMSAESYIQFMLRGCAGSVPGVKASTVHGDYRGSSFASEKSADNDTWRETEQVQEEFCAAFCSPVWRTMVESGVMAGWFNEHPAVDGRGFNLAKYRSRRAAYDAVAWAGPVAKSINPNQDAIAIAQEIRNGQNNAIDAAASVGMNARENLKKQAALMKFAKAQGLPEGVIAQMLGMTVAQATPGGELEVETGAEATGDGAAADQPAKGAIGVAA